MEPEADVRMPLTEHLEELRRRLVRALLATLLAFAACWFWAEPLVQWLTRPLLAIEADGARIIGTGVTDAFFTKLKVAFIAGVFVASPVIFFQTWRFVAPGLYDREKRLAIPFTVAATVFFVAGAGFCYAIVFPVAFRFFLTEFASIALSPEIRISEYLSFVTRMLLARRHLRRHLTDERGELRRDRHRLVFGGVRHVLEMERDLLDVAA
jgi:sec-independent protein translocase protein TatC